MCITCDDGTCRGESIGCGRTASVRGFHRAISRRRLGTIKNSAHSSPPLRPTEPASVFAPRCLPSERANGTSELTAVKRSR